MLHGQKLREKWIKTIRTKQNKKRNNTQEAVEISFYYNMFRGHREENLTVDSYNSSHITSQHHELFGLLTWPPWTFTPSKYLHSLASISLLLTGFSFVFVRFSTLYKHLCTIAKYMFILCSITKHA